MTSQFLSWFFAELMFVTLVFVSINFTKKPKSRRSHKEALQAFSSRGSSPFEENKRRYLEAIKNGKYRSKDLACKDLYDLDQEFYQCLESVYFD